MDDHMAVRQCLTGDPDAFGVLIERHQAVVLALCLRMTGSRADALDACQQAFVRAYQHLDRYDTHLPFRPWLMKIATNECIAHLRRQRRRPVPLEPLELEAAGGEAPTVAGLVELTLDRERVRQAVARLPDHYRVIVLRFYFEEQSYQEIARDLQLPMGTVATHLSRAKQLLRKILTAEGGATDDTPDAPARTAISRR